MRNNVKIATTFLAVTGLWVLALRQQWSPAVAWVVQILPMYALVSFGFYSLAVIGYRVASFPTCPEASVELQREILEARADLTAKGVLEPRETADGKKPRKRTPRA
mmetsp:Transcript_25153/g.42086  ORF Transcript_25153/g.42086 Transcript_25153/m.42086 type:complete len:106 (-) Transcript_25153:676-993(-)|eukprot:CAMPEP_0198199396 /NCGR_PEP_ID=MMETSP1445-20131203/2705_1 /TAXON_ID=36898 /ORGANISM="Pyramimonas sp., Strain CCMP2087" /LENGTH=105 /DNA_ID=CAMNT_0043869235 /DNA_START=90 /DNA_END=407 /DNA_ORIENTATION=+